MGEEENYILADNVAADRDLKGSSFTQDYPTPGLHISCPIIDSYMYLPPYAEFVDLIFFVRTNRSDEFQTYRAVIIQYTLVGRLEPVFAEPSTISCFHGHFFFFFFFLVITHEDHRSN